MGIEKELMEQVTRLMDITHDLRCSVQVMREALLASFEYLSPEQRRALASNVRNRADQLLSQVDDSAGAQMTRERIALEAHLLTQPLRE